MRIEGGWSDGYVLFADLHRPRLGLRWESPTAGRSNILKTVGMSRPAPFDPDEWARRALRDEVGHLPSLEARSLPLPESSWRGSMIYCDSDPPGRDAWVAHSPVSGRNVDLVYHARRRDSVLAESIVPTLRDQPPDAPTRWSVFDLSCIAPAHLMLRDHQLRAGDLRLTFVQPQRLISIRQIAVAKVALSRMPLEGWLRQEQGAGSLRYRAKDQPRPIAHRCSDGRELIGIMQSVKRRRRFFFLPWLFEELHTEALHDAVRDRLILIRGSDLTVLHDVMRTIGCE